MTSNRIRIGVLAAALSAAVVAQDTAKKPSSYMPVVIPEDFVTTMSRMTAAKPDIMKRQAALLEQRYDLSDRPAAGITMSRGQAVQGGVRVKLRAGMTWFYQAATTPENIQS